eukprot:UN05676
MKQSEVWCSDQQNPDYKLVTLHAANPGFQAKLNAVDGSYLIREFAKAMIANADIQNVEQRQFLGEIMDGIQHNLHERGKQQTVNVYNNFTQYLKFEKNNKMLNLKGTNNVAIDKKQKEEIDGDINDSIVEEMVETNTGMTVAIGLNVDGLYQQIATPSTTLEPLHSKSEF